MSNPQRTHRRAALTVGLLTAATLVAAGCSSTTPTTDVSQDPNSEILIWTDATRQAGFEQYAADHPDAKIKIETYDAAGLLAKILLFNKTGEGWPDVVFSGGPGNIASLASERFGYAQDLGEFVDESTLEGFGAANGDCTIDGATYCLKNDLAQTVLWYNEPLMKEWGYAVPTTWEEYAALGEKVAADHPGYVIGSAGSNGSYQDYFVPSGCPLQDVASTDEVRIDTSADECTRVASMLDELIDNGSVSRFGNFDPEFIALGQAQKILMLPAASWYGDFVFNSDANYNYPDGLITAAPNPKWAGEDEAWSGSQGGGIYVVSRHSKNKALAADVVKWMATDVDYQTDASTYPAYGPAAEAWGERIAADSFYASDPFPALQAQATLINPVAHLTRYSVGEAFNTTVVAAVKAKTPIVDSLAQLQTTLTSLATTAGYTVVQ